MYFDSLDALWLMGGHGLYVWLAYGSWLLLLVGNWAAAGLRRRAAIAVALAEATARAVTDSPGETGGNSTVSDTP